MPAWSGLWNRDDASPGDYALLVNKNPNRNRMKRLVNRDGFRVITELFDSLIGAASGGTASATHKRIAEAPTGLGASGGLRTIETVTDINRATTAADITKLKEMTVGVKTAPTTYPTNLAGNGIK